MAIVSSPLFDNISGKCGGLVFYKRGDKIVMKSLPLKKKHRKYSVEQMVRQALFKEAKAKFWLILRDPVEMAKYVARCPSNRNIKNFITSELLLELGAATT
jgi:hypothetical protein